MKPHTRNASLTRILAADGRLVADGGNPCSAVTRAAHLVQVNLEPVDLGAKAVVVVELPTKRARNRGG